jgi:predicted nuclease of predicted toxin-antitoxin system
VKVLCDVHIALKVVRFFQKNNVEATNVNGLPDSFYSSDKDTCKFTDQNDQVVLAKDSDFFKLLLGATNAN